MIRRLFFGAISLAIFAAGAAWAECSFQNDIPLASLSNSFESWKLVTDAMADCGNFTAELDQDFREKQPAAMAANPSQYAIGGVSNSTLVPLLGDGLVRSLDDLVAEYGQDLAPSQLIKIDGQIVAIAMQVNAQHLMYRSDVLDALEIAVPTTYDELLAAAEKIQSSELVDYPLGGTYAAGWNLGEEFVNMYLGMGGAFFGEGNMPAINNEQGLAALEMMKSLTAYMDPEFLAADSTFVQQQFQQGQIAMANLWATRAGAMDNAEESEVVGLVEFAAAPAAVPGGPPATTLWWDGMTVATNISDAEAEAAFRLMMEGLSFDVLSANPDTAIWLSSGEIESRIAAGAIASARGGAPSYPASNVMGLLHTAAGNNIADFLTGSESAEATLADIEAEYIAAAKEAGLIE
jgi:ABC-type glycerol-3-phosphate transport system substrate-binding protein